MCVVQRSRVNRIAIAAACAFMMGGAAFAQTVQVFDDAPSIEQLRSIMVPESRAGASRSIVIQRPDTGAPAVQRASTQVLPAPRVAAIASVPERHQPPAPMPVPKRDAATESGAVAFHVNFGFDSTRMPDAARPMIDMIVQLMKESPDIKVRVEGHTDATGSADYNASLSERRARAVGVYLVKQGVEASRLLLIGKGMAEPIARDRYDPANRRVQFVRVG